MYFAINQTKLLIFCDITPFLFLLFQESFYYLFTRKTDFSGEVLGEVNTLEKPLFDIILTQKKPGDFPKLSFSLLIIRNLPILTC